MNTLRLLSIFWMLPCLAFAQQSFELGAFLGVINYQGDLADDPVEYSETNFAFGAMSRYMFTPKIAIKGNLYYGKLVGDDANTANANFRGWRFEANLIELSVVGEYHPFGRSRLSSIGFFRQQATPFIFAGVGGTYAKSNMEVPQRDINRVPEINDRSFFLSVPIGVGFRYDVSEYFLFAGEFGSRAVFSDHLDGTHSNGQVGTNDWYLFGGFTISILIDTQRFIRF